MTKQSRADEEDKHVGDEVEVPRDRHGAEISALLGASDAQLLDFGLEGGAFHAEPSSGTSGTSDDPTGFAQSFQNVFAFRLLEGRGHRVCRVVRRPL
jgi:hypothetical protein